MERGRLREQRLDAIEERGRRLRKDVDLRKWSAARTCARAHVRIERFQAVGEEVAARGPGMREDRTLAAARRAEAREAVDARHDRERVRQRRAVAGAARDHPGILAIGLILSVALMGLAANVLARVIERYRWLAYVGLLVILWVAGKMIWEGLTDPTRGVLTLLA